MLASSPVSNLHQFTNNGLTNDSHNPKASNDTHSESSAGSPVDYSLAIDCSNNKQALTKGNSNAASDTTSSDFKSNSPISEEADDLLEVKCTHCGCLFATEQMLKMHIIDMHSNKTISLGSEADAVNGLLSLNQESSINRLNATELLDGEVPINNGKVMNPDAYCETCQKEFRNNYFLSMHMATKHGKTTGDCSMLGGVPSSLTSQLTSGSLEDQLCCPMCSMTFPNQFLLQGHLVTVHSPAANMSMNSGMNPFQVLYTAQLMNGLGESASLPVQQQDNAMSSLLQRMKFMAAMGMQGGLPNAIPSPLNINGGSSYARPGSFDMPFSDLQHNHTNNNINTEVPEPGAINSVGMVSNVWDSLGQSGSVSPNGNAKEAYCEFCDKTFCNKYFLKTHKLKKHGIGSSPCNNDEGNGMNARMFPYPSMVSNDGVIKSTHSLSQQAQQIQKNPQSYLEALMSGALKYDAQQTSPTDSGLASDGSSAGDAKVPKLEANSADEQEHNRSQSTEDLQSQFNNNNIMNSAGLSMSSLVCNMCAKSFSSVFSLVAHKYRDHNGLGMDNGSLAGLTGCLTAGLPGVMPPFGTPSSFLGNRTPQKENDPLMAEGRSPVEGGITDPDAYCEICKKEFCSKYFLRTHKQNIHGIPMESTPPSFNNFQSMLAMSSYTPEKMNKSMTPSGQSPSLSKNKSRYSVGKNFCDVCNKEVCNKYFLRTHMLKMHGIVIDENKTVIGNINTLDREKTGALVFRCDVCSKEFHTRQLLKTHKQTSHGVNSNPSTPHITQAMDKNTVGSMYPTFVQGPPNITVAPTMVNANSCINNINSEFNNSAQSLPCKICYSTFASDAALNMHMLHEHAFNNSDAGDDVTNVDDVTLQCEFCPDAFNNVPALQLHLINQHVDQIQAKAVSLASQAMGTLDPQTVNKVVQEQRQILEAHNIGDNNPVINENTVISEQISNNAIPKPSTSPPMVVRQNNGTKLYRCSYCHYYTKWRSNLSVHERRHLSNGNDRLPTESVNNAEKPHVCEICMRSYRYAHSLERHKQVHRLSAMGHKWANSPEKKAQRAAANLSGAMLSPEKCAKRFRCSQCEKVFKSRDLCRSHLFAAHRRNVTTEINAMDRSVCEVVENVHLAAVRETVMETVYPEGYSESLPGDMKPYILQAFNLTPVGDTNGQIKDCIVHLPVNSNIAHIQSVTFKLTPATPKGGHVINI